MEPAAPAAVNEPGGCRSTDPRARSVGGPFAGLAGAKAWTDGYCTVEPRSGRDVIAQFLPQSPFVAKLGIVADQLRDDEVRLRLPWDPSNVTVGDMVHGGAIATLADLHRHGGGLVRRGSAARTAWA